MHSRIDPFGLIGAGGGCFGGLEGGGASSHITLSNWPSRGSLYCVILLAVPAHLHTKVDISADVRVIPLYVGLVVPSKPVGVDGDAPTSAEGVYTPLEGASVYKFGAVGYEVILATASTGIQQSRDMASLCGI